MGRPGRMGTRLIQLIAGDPELELGAALERAGHPQLGEDAGSSGRRLPARRRARIVAGRRSRSSTS